MFLTALRVLHILPYHMQSSFQIDPHLAYNQPDRNQRLIVVRLGPCENKEYFLVLNRDEQCQYCGGSVAPREFVSVLERLLFRQMIFHLNTVILKLMTGTLPALSIRSKSSPPVANSNTR